MPIRPELRAFYTKASGWPEVRESIVLRASGTCECTGECGNCRDRCGAPDRRHIVREPMRPWAWRLARETEKARATLVVLTVAHLNRQAGDNRPENLKALCQRCHLVYDLRQHISTRARTAQSEQAALGQLTLPIAQASAGVS